MVGLLTTTGEPMQIVIHDNRVVATHADGQGLAGLYPGCLILTVPDATPVEIGQAWEVTLTQAVAARTLEAAAAAQAALAPLAARFPEHETKTWPAQLAEAALILSDPEPSIEKYPAIGEIISVTGESWRDFALSVQANDAAWTKISCNVAGQRQKFVMELANVAKKDGVTVADILAIPLSISLPV